MTKEKKKNNRKFDYKILTTFIIIMIITLVISYIISKQISYDGAKKDFEEVGNWGDTWVDSETLRFNPSEPGATSKTTITLNVTWFVEKPYKLKIKWSDFIGEEVPSEKILASNFYISLKDDKENYKQLSDDWVILHKSIRPNMEQIKIFFKCEIPDVIYDQNYTGEYNWLVEPSKTAEEYANEHWFDPYRF